MSLPTSAELAALVPALAPGLVILGIRQWFVAAPQSPLEERLVSYACVSAVYYAFAHPLAALSTTVAPGMVAIVEATEYLVAPAALGLLLGAATKEDWGQSLARLFRLKPHHHAPTAWDYAFSRMSEERFVLVTLSDGSTVGGLYGEGSFAASSASERDLLITKVYDVGEPWTERHPPHSILICGKDIRFVEFLKGE